MLSNDWKNCPDNDAAKPFIDWTGEAAIYFCSIPPNPNRTNSTMEPTLKIKNARPVMRILRHLARINGQFGTTLRFIRCPPRSLEPAKTPSLIS